MVKNILITGGLSYVGGRIVQALSDSNKYNIYITSRYFKECPIPNVILIVTDYEDLDKVFSTPFDQVIHLAALNEIGSSADPNLAIDVNVKLTNRILNYAIKNSIKKFIYFSTIHVYGRLKGEIKESYSGIPTHPYATSKKAAEIFVMAARKNSNLDALVVRLSNSFGYPLTPDVKRWTLLVNNLCKSAVAEKKIVLKNKIDTKRDFVTLGDVCQATEILLSNAIDQNDNGIFNLGSANSMAITKIAQIIQSRCKHVLGYEPELIIKNPDGLLKSNEPDFLFSIKKLEDLGYTPLQEINIEIDKTLKLCQRVNENNEARQ